MGQSRECVPPDGEKTGLKEQFSKPAPVISCSTLGTVELNKLLEKEILKKTDIVPFKIHDSDPENSLTTLQQNLIAAYPDN